MKLYLVQHGEAKDEDDDPARPLTDGGIDDVTRVARLAVEGLGVSPARVVHSGKTRARQTAEIWGGLLGAEVVQAEGLAPKDDVAIWLRQIDGETDDLMIVGHLPHLARLTASLVTGNAGTPVVAFRPGGLVALEQAGTGWEVFVVLPPELLRPSAVE